MIFALPLDEIFDRSIPLIVLTTNLSHKIETCRTIDHIISIHFTFVTSGWACERICSFICLVLLKVAKRQHKSAFHILDTLQNCDCIVQISNTMITCRQCIQILFTRPLSIEIHLRSCDCDFNMLEDLRRILNVQRKKWHHQGEMSRCKLVLCPVAQ